MKKCIVTCERDVKAVLGIVVICCASWCDYLR